MIKKKKEKPNKNTHVIERNAVTKQSATQHVIASEAKQSHGVKTPNDIQIALGFSTLRNDMNIDLQIATAFSMPRNDMNIDDMKKTHVIASVAKQSHGRKAFVPLQIASVVSLPRNDMNIDLQIATAFSMPRNDMNIDNDESRKAVVSC